MEACRVHRRALQWAENRPKMLLSMVVAVAVTRPRLCVLRVEDYRQHYRSSFKSTTTYTQKYSGRVPTPG